MDKIGCDMFMDVHGDESISYNFICGNYTGKWGPRLEELQEKFLDTIIEINPDMQKEFGYDDDEIDLTICSDQIGERFGCLSFTLEMPFKDNTLFPEPNCEWSPRRSMRLGSSFLDAISKEMSNFRT